MAFSATALAVGIGVGDRADVEFVHIADRDRERSCGGRAVSLRGGPDRDVVAGGRLAVEPAGHGDDARIGVDR